MLSRAEPCSPPPPPDGGRLAVPTRLLCCLLLLWPPQHGFELWATDGTATNGTGTGVRMVRDITWGATSTDFSAARCVGDRLQFSVGAWHGPQAAPVPWYSDGTFDGTRRVADADLRVEL